MTARIVREKTAKEKPSKPNPDFPLSAHACGKWYKKVGGEFYYFGTWDDPEAALNDWLDRKDGILAGRDHDRHDERDESDDDVAYLCNEFLEAKQQKVNDGEIAQSTYDGYEEASDRFVAFIGKRRKLDTITPADFRRYRRSWPTTWGSSSINNEIARVRTILNFGYKNGIVDRPFRTGENFQRVSRKKQRLERSKKPKKLFQASEIHGLLDAADFQVRAMILLGINCGYGNADCGRLKVPMIDFGRCWLEGLREKTAVERAAWLWPETVEAIEYAIENRFGNRPESLTDNVFVTKRRQAWFRDTGKDDAITAAFGKLKTKVLINPVVKEAVEGGGKREKVLAETKAKWNGVGFYALRHTFETIAGNSKDQIATNYVMGHCDDSMAAVYREGIDPQRIIDVCSFVRDWWIDGKPTKEVTS